MFKEHFASLSFGHLGSECTDTKYWQQLEIPGIRRKHNRNVLAPSAISAMFRIGLLGGATMWQVMVLYDLACIDSALDCWYDLTPKSTVPPFMHAGADLVMCVCVWV